MLTSGSYLLVVVIVVVVDVTGARSSVLAMELASPINESERIATHANG